MIRSAVRTAPLLAALALLAAALEPLGAQSSEVSSSREMPEAIGCWTVRVETVSRGDPAEAMGLPAQIRIDPGGDALASRDGTTRRGSWQVGNDGALRVTVSLVSGGATTLELTRSDAEWVGFLRAVGESNLARIRNPPRVTLFRANGCPKV